MHKCVLCNSEWGNYWEEINSKNLFFCCVICVDQYKAVIKAIQFHTGWKIIEKITFEGNSRYRKGFANSKQGIVEFSVSFLSDGKLWSFSPIYDSSSELDSLD